MTLEPGLKIDRFEIQQLLGSGGMGSVYLAFDPRLRRMVALKQILPGLKPGFRQRLEREAIAASALNHPHILTVHELGEFEGVDFIVSEYVAGQTLRQLLRGGSRSLEAVLEIGIQISAAMAAAQDARIVHRDLKPENLMLRPDGIVKILDFGLAQGIDEGVSLTESSEFGVFGTLQYMAPEQIQGEKLDSRADIWSLGVVLYELLMGIPPFRAETMLALVAEILTKDLFPMEERLVPGPLANLLKKALEKRPEQRLGHFREFHEGLRELFLDLQMESRRLGHRLPGLAKTATAVVVPSVEMGVPLVGSETQTQPMPDLNRIATMESHSQDTQSFVGRTRELASLNLLLQERHRLVTLVGPGGCGKTRLAERLLRQVSEAFAGVRLVELSQIRDPEWVSGAVLHELGLSESEEGAAAALAREIGESRFLLLLDNFEQVSAAAPILSTWLLACPGLQLLVTSREPLHLREETLFRLDPLELPDQISGMTTESLWQVEAISLFVARAKKARPDFEMTRVNATAVVEICRRLDGLPLAIELAAARVALLEPEQILERLNEGLGLLTGGGRDQPRRRQTMRDAIDWSYRLLNPTERELFVGLSLFNGSFEVSAAEAIYGRAPHFYEDLSSLVEKNMLRRLRDGGETRFALFATIRDFGMEMLELAGERLGLESEHASHFLTLAQRMEPELKGPRQAASMARLTRELDNLRQSLTWFLRTGQIESAARMATALELFWYYCGHYREGLEWLNRIAASLEPDSTQRIPVLSSLGTLSLMFCDYGNAVKYLGECANQAEREGREEILARARHLYGAVSRERGDYEAALESFAQAVDLYEHLGEEEASLNSRSGMTFTLWLMGRLEQARELNRYNLERLQRVKNPLRAWWIQLHRAIIAFLGGEDEEARALLEDCLDEAEEKGFKEGRAWSSHYLGLLGLRDEDWRAAAQGLTTSLETHLELGDRWRASSVLDGLAALAESLGRGGDAVRLMTAADAMRRRIGVKIPLHELEARQALWLRLEAQLGSLRPKCAEEGRKMRDHECLELARSLVAS